MGALLGHLGISETDLSFMSRMGQRVVYDGITQYLAAHTLDLQKRESALIDLETEEIQLKYKLPIHCRKSDPPTLYQSCLPRCPQNRFA